MALSRSLDDTFKVSVTIKGIDGAMEIIGGIALLFIRPSTIDHAMSWCHFGAKTC